MVLYGRPPNLHEDECQELSLPSEVYVWGVALC